jgi:hypothetical protein
VARATVGGRLGIEPRTAGEGSGRSSTVPGLTAAPVAAAVRPLAGAIPERCFEPTAGRSTSLAQRRSHAGCSPPEAARSPMQSRYRREGSRPSRPAGSGGFVRHGTPTAAPGDRPTNIWNDAEGLRPDRPMAECGIRRRHRALKSRPSRQESPLASVSGRLRPAGFAPILPPCAPG